MTMGVGSGELMAQALALAAKRGRVVVTNIHPALEMAASVSLLDLTLMEKQVVGSLFGSANPERVQDSAPDRSVSTSKARSSPPDAAAPTRRRRSRPMTRSSNR